MSIGSTINNNLAVQGNLDVSGGIIYFSQQQLTSQQQFKNIQLNTPTQAYLSFPAITNAFTPYTTCNQYAPQGLGIIWNYKGKEETDLIGYGGAGAGTGGISIYSYNTNGSPNTTPGDASYNIADFWPGGSSIYTGLDISGNLNVGENLVINNNNNYGNYNQTFTLTTIGEYVSFSLQPETGAFVIVTMTYNSTFYVNMYAISCINNSGGNKSFGILINPGNSNQLNFTQYAIGFEIYPNDDYYPATINISFLNATFSTSPYID